MRVSLPLPAAGLSARGQMREFGQRRAKALPLNCGQLGFAAFISTEPGARESWYLR